MPLEIRIMNLGDVELDSGFWSGDMNRVKG
jgi:hypothetical protein